MSISMFGYVSNDAIMKLVAPQIGLGQSIFVRGIFCSIFLIIILWLMGINFEQCKLESTEGGKFAPIEKSNRLGNLDEKRIEKLMI